MHIDNSLTAPIKKAKNAATLMAKNNQVVNALCSQMETIQKHPSNHPQHVMNAAMLEMSLLTAVTQRIQLTEALALFN